MTPEQEKILIVARARARVKANKATPAPAPAPVRPPQERAGLPRALAEGGLSVLSNVLVGGTVGPFAGIAARLTGNDPEAAKEAVNRNMVYSPSPAAKERLAPITGPLIPIGRGMAALDEAVPLPAGVGTLVGTAMDVAGAAPVAGGLVRAAQRGVQAVQNVPKMLSPAQRGLRQARKIAQEAAGSNIGAIRDALGKAGDDLTAGQAAAGVDQDTFQALQALARRKDKSSFYRVMDDTQEAARAKALQDVTPDVPSAERIREATSRPLYEQADDTLVQLTPDMQAAIDRLPKGMLEWAQEKARVAGTPFILNRGRAADSLTNSPAIPPSTSGGTLHTIKKALDDAALGRDTTGKQVIDAATAKASRPGFISAFERQVPVYRDARQEFRARSAPVNQGEVLGEVSRTLRDARGGERVGPLLNTLEKSPETLLKRALGQQGAKQTLRDVLDPEQLSTVNRVVAELQRDEQIARQATAGAGGLSRIVKDNTSTFRLPSLLSRPAAVANKGLEMAEGRLNAATVDALVNGMKSGKSARELLGDIPAPERDFLLELARGGQKRSGLVRALAAGNIGNQVEE